MAISSVPQSMLIKRYIDNNCNQFIYIFKRQRLHRGNKQLKHSSAAENNDANNTFIPLVTSVLNPASYNKIPDLTILYQASLPKL